MSITNGGINDAHLGRRMLQDLVAYAVPIRLRRSLDDPGLEPHLAAVARLAAHPRTSMQTRTVPDNA
jgi:hypothetical protein